VWEKSKEDLNALKSQNKSLQLTIQLQNQRIEALRKQLKQEKKDPNLLEKISSELSSSKSE